MSWNSHAANVSKRISFSIRRVAVHFTFLQADHLIGGKHVYSDRRRSLQFFKHVDVRINQSLPSFSNGVPLTWSMPLQMLSINVVSSPASIDHICYSKCVKTNPPSENLNVQHQVSATDNF